MRSSCCCWSSSSSSSGDTGGALRAPPNARVQRGRSASGRSSWVWLRESRVSCAAHEEGWWRASTATLLRVCCSLAVASPKAPDANQAANFVVLLDERWGERKLASVIQVLVEDLEVVARAFPEKVARSLGDAMHLWVHEDDDRGGAETHYVPKQLLASCEIKERQFAVEINSWQSYMTGCLARSNTLLHEFAHVFNGMLGLHEPQFKELFQHGVDSGKYDLVAFRHNIESLRGPEEKRRAYGLINSMEFFASLSVAFLGGLNDYEPFDRAGLDDLDPESSAKLAEIYNAADGAPSCSMPGLRRGLAAAAQASRRAAGGAGRCGAAVRGAGASNAAAAMWMRMRMTRTATRTAASPGARRALGSAAASAVGGKEGEQEDPKARILHAALGHVNRRGWTNEALAAGAVDTGFPPVTHGLFKRGPAELAEWWMDKGNAELDEFLQAELDNRETGKRGEDLVREALWRRLQHGVPYLQSWPQAMALGLYPENVTTTLQKLHEIPDLITQAANESEDSAAWDDRKGAIGAVYAASELYMLTDYSEGFEDTKAFLAARLRDGVLVQDKVGPSADTLAAVASGLGSLVSAAASLAAPLVPKPASGAPPNPQQVLDQLRSGFGAAGLTVQEIATSPNPLLGTLSKLQQLSPLHQQQRQQHHQEQQEQQKDGASDKDDFGDLAGLDQDTPLAPVNLPAKMFL
ncbi:Ubiquinone biosynthesis protein COQ9 [Durusdinium trenchii]|uniref:Ubiquinone biosynthesis protein n=1 Tax=Durusdinium trenchii TaxID=1381693 RepID=A0ABP0R6T1_9DINO